MSSISTSAPPPAPRGALGLLSRIDLRDTNTIVYIALGVIALFYPITVQFLTGGNGNALVGLAADAGVYVLMAIGLNVVVGFAGLLDLGYAAFFAFGAYTYALFASNQLTSTPYGHAIHLSFWVTLPLGLLIAATMGVLLGAPTLRLRGDYLAIVTLGFGEIVPRLFRNLAQWTGGVNGVSALDAPKLPAWLEGPWVDQPLRIVSPFQFTSSNATAFYVVMVLIIVLSVVLVNNLRRSRLGRAWVAIREDELAAASMGINTVSTKLLAFGIGAATSGFAGVFFAAKLSVVSPENFTFLVSVTILVMITLGGMGNIPGAIVGSLIIYMVLFKILPELPGQTSSLATSLGLDSLNRRSGDWPGLAEFVSRLKFLIYGLILAGTLLLRPQGLVPSQAARDSQKARKAEEELVSA